MMTVFVEFFFYPIREFAFIGNPKDFSAMETGIFSVNQKSSEHLRSEFTGFGSETALSKKILKFSVAILFAQRFRTQNKNFVDIALQILILDTIIGRTEIHMVFFSHSFFSLPKLPTLHSGERERLSVLRRKDRRESREASLHRWAC